MAPRLLLIAFLLGRVEIEPMQGFAEVVQPPKSWSFFFHVCFVILDVQRAILQ